MKFAVVTKYEAGGFDVDGFETEKSAEDDARRQASLCGPGDRVYVCQPVSVYERPEVPEPIRKTLVMMIGDGITTATATKKKRAKAKR